MPIAFTAEERTVLTGQLLESTRRFVKEQSARKVTIKQLTDSVGISKGAFYLFYPSKEHLFMRCCARCIPNCTARPWSCWNSLRARPHSS